MSLVKRIAYVYLLIPIFIFGVGWLNAVAALFFSLLMTAGLMAVWKKESPLGFISSGKRDWLFAGLLLFFWIYLSGIGGYAFQNWDHHSRNAVFHDLIKYKWPVTYHFDAAVAARFNAPPDLVLSYYFGFWLPVVLIGKVVGLGLANPFLFVWAFVGIVLAVVLTSQSSKLSLIKTSFLIILFSGMDIVGVWLFQWIPNFDYPGFWPSIQHLEWWAGSLQYSTFTTGLFWTYNQFVPALLIMSLFVFTANTEDAVLLFGICFFFAPLPALGLLPFVVFRFIKKLSSDLTEKRFGRGLILYRTIFTWENIAGLVIACVSLLFYSTNLSAQSRTVQLSSPILIYLIFILLEGMLIWLLLFPSYRKDWMWYISGFILVLAPFVKVGESWDFVMRTTMPSLYILMIGCGSFLAKKQESKTRLLLVLMLALGALTPIYEINRSLVRTDQYYGYLLFSRVYFERYFQNPPLTNQAFIPEFDHMGTLIADDWQSVSIPNESGWDTKVGTLFDPSFSFLWKDELIQK